MKKQGSIVLGSGGDCCRTNNNLSAGTFYEGAIVAGYPTDAADVDGLRNPKQSRVEFGLGPTSSRKFWSMVAIA